MSLEIREPNSKELSKLEPNTKKKPLASEQ